MSVYKEGFMIVEAIMRKEQRIFSDAADSGTIVTKGDSTWKSIKQLYDGYGVQGTRVKGKHSASFEFELVDEGQGGEVMRFKLTFSLLERWAKHPALMADKRAHAFVTIERIFLNQKLDENE